MVADAPQKVGPITAKGRVHLSATGNKYLIGKKYLHY